MAHPSPIVKTVSADAWQSLKHFTNARIAIGRAGHAIPLAENLRFKADHANARDAVYAEMDVDQLTTCLAAMHLPVLQLHTQAKNRSEYLQRPDKGRKLDEISLKKIEKTDRYDIAFIIADGLSARSVEIYAQPVLHFLLPQCINHGFSIAPVSIIQQARVAVGDEVGMLLNASLSIIFIGERPGLSSPHSMGIYITYKPVTGLTDESRYCISNIHTPGGLSSKEAALQAFSLIKASFAQQLSGINAKAITK